ncbi:unnamed protein product [Alopecurus aequalis]
MWAVWKARTDRRHGKIPLNLEAACRWARDTSADLVTEARNLGGTALKLLKPATWSPPPIGAVKVNVDAAFDQDGLQGATGMVIRGHDGCFIAAKAKRYDNLPNVLVAEALACRDGVQLCHDAKAVHVVLETDCQSLIELWKTREKNRSEVLSVLNDIQDISKEFTSFSFTYIGRAANLVAHRLAKQTSVARPESTWVHQAPTCITACIQHDNSVVAV